LSKEDILDPLLAIRSFCLKGITGYLFILVNDLSIRSAIRVFFASLDIPQESSIHGQILEHIASRSGRFAVKLWRTDDGQKIETLLNIRQEAAAASFEDELTKRHSANHRPVKRSSVKRPGGL